MDKLRKIFIIIVLTIGIGFLFPQDSYTIDRSDFGTITLDLKDVDILDVLKIFSMHSGLSIVAGQDVRARVTIFLKDVNAWDAFEVILAANNLAYKEDDGIIKVMTERNYIAQYGKPFYDKTIVESIKLKNARAEDVSNALNQIKSEVGKVIVDARSNTVIVKDTPEMVEKMKEVIKSLEVPPQTKVFTLKYADVEEMIDKIKENLTEGVGSVEIDKRTGKIVVTDIPPKLKQITKMLKSFDEKSREVLIEAKIVEVSLNPKYRLGIDWSGVFEKLNIGVNVEHGRLVYYTNIPKDGLPLIMDAFKRMGETRVISQPKILVLNHKEATIGVEKRQPYVTTSVSELGAETTQVVESITFIDIGTQLSVTPTINPDGFITMKIKPRVSSHIGDFTYKSSYGKAVERKIPIERTSEAETTLMVKGGRTVVIGGLMRKKVDRSEKRVPVLSNIPFLGNVFKHKTRETRNTELAIFLTPHIVTGEESMEVAKLEEKGKISPPTVSERPTFSWLKKGKKSAYTDYYLALSSLLSNYIAKNYTPTEIGGRVNLILTIDSNGKLVGSPKIINTPGKELAETAKRLIREASPFPPFPRQLEKDKENFRISVNLPSLEGRPSISPKEKIPDFYKLSSKDMAYSEYYLTLSELISNYMVRNYPSTKGGKVEIVFKLSRDGKLIGRPEVSQEVNPQLRELTIQAMRELSPFPPFPEELKASEKVFRILITIPERKASPKREEKDKLANYKNFQSIKSKDNQTLSSKSEFNYGSSQLTYDEYKRYISRKISQFITSSLESEGEVKIAFTLDNNGNLMEAPKILKSPDKRLSQLTIQAVREASPFPKLPQSIAQDQAIFEISVVYK